MCKVYTKADWISSVADERVYKMRNIELFLWIQNLILQLFQMTNPITKKFIELITKYN